MSWINLVPRVSHLTASLAPVGGKMRDPGNEVGHGLGLRCPFIAEISLTMLERSAS